MMNGTSPNTLQTLRNQRIAIEILLKRARYYTNPQNPKKYILILKIYKILF